VKTALYDLAHARSGDKGDVCNVGVIARRPECWPVLRHPRARHASRAASVHLPLQSAPRS
jgi:hypothetical protein